MIYKCIINVIKLFISILTDFVTSHKIVFYSKLYDIDFLENFTHDRTYIILYVHEFLLSLHKHCFYGQKSPTYYLKPKLDAILMSTSNLICSFIIHCMVMDCKSLIYVCMCDIWCIRGSPSSLIVLLNDFLVALT